MTRVGSRQMKNRFGHYLARVKRGETVLITDRGKAVAKVTPLDHSRALQDVHEEAIFKFLVETGAVTPSLGKPLAPFKAVRTKGKPASRMIIADRR